jgi:hypothetical protein
MKLYYRISDKSYDKSKLIGATKEVCLMNFCKAFAPVIFADFDPSDEEYVPPMSIIADNCERKTIKMAHETGMPVTLTSEGNAGSFRKALELALEEDDDEIVYFVEDDYLHLGSAPKLLQEGIKRSDYVTLYDHPDKYTRYYNGGEHSKVIKTASSHWRYTLSTCMTFGAKVKTLREDKDIWFNEDLTGGDHPHDHHIFTKIAEKNRRVAVCIPGVACHVDLTFSGVVSYMLMEHWAIDMMIEELTAQIQVAQDGLSIDENIEFQKLKESMVGDKTGQEKLMALDALRQQIKKA